MSKDNLSCVSESKTQSKLNSPVWLKCSDRRWTGHWFVEKFIFLKLQRYKNNPRANYLVFRAVWTVIAVTFLATAVVFLGSCFVCKGLRCLGCTAFKIDLDWWGSSLALLIDQKLIKIAVTLLGAMSLAYWNLSTVFRQQWTYAASLYNEMLKKPELGHLIANGLALDLLVLDLWAHRSFKDLFRDELEEAITAKYGQSPIILAEKMQRVRDREMSEDEARGLIEDYQDLLVSESQNETTIPNAPCAIAGILQRFCAVSAAK